MCNSLLTLSIFGEKVDAAWCVRQGVDSECWDLALPFMPQEKLEVLHAGAAANRYIGRNHRIFIECADLEQSHDALVSGPHLFWHLLRFDRMHESDTLPGTLNRHGATHAFQHFYLYDKTVAWINLLMAPVREASQFNVGATYGMCGAEWSPYAWTAMANPAAYAARKNCRRGGFCRCARLSGELPFGLLRRSKPHRRRWLDHLVGSD